MRGHCRARSDGSHSMACVNDFATRKANRKQKRAVSILQKDTGIEYSLLPTKHLFFGNIGLSTGLNYECLLSECLKYGDVDDIVLIPGKSYCFVTFQSVDSSLKAFTKNHGKQNEIFHPTKCIYASFSKRVPNLERIEWNKKPPGVDILEDFITDAEQITLLNCINWVNSGQSLKHRKVQHYGYEFLYSENTINKDTPLADGIPSECNFIFDRLRKFGYCLSNPDQLTINEYSPGQGIPPHIDTHSACEEFILSLSLGSSIIMDFKHRDGHHIPVFVPQKSLLIMSGEGRYAWSHGITARKTDVIQTKNAGLKVQNRSTRVSFTFRWVRKNKCNCPYYLECDSQSLKTQVVENEHLATEIEKKHVHKVYEEIAHHFSETRHKPWSKVLQFVQQLSCSSLLVDVGCGNGKYLKQNKNIFEIGCDSSSSLAQLCNEHGHQVFTCNCLAVPLRDNIADACISIAVIHHLATQTRRQKSLEEIVRILKPGGKALIYVWARDQEYNERKSSYLKQNSRSKKKSHSSRDVSAETASGNTTVTEECAEPIKYDSSLACENTFQLPLHVNRTQFKHQDVFVPWKLKSQSRTDTPTYYRYYHVFEKGELERMCLLLPKTSIQETYYDQGNWCVVLQKNER